MSRSGKESAPLRLSAVCALCVVALLALGGLWASTATAVQLKSGEGSALSELTQGGEEEQTTSTSTATTGTTEEPRNSSSTLVIVAIVAVVLLSGIAYVIVRDARRAAPATEPELAQGSTARHSEAALRKRRSKAKAARQQRKRNR